MRKLFTFNMVTLDGFFEGPNGEIDWHNADNEEFNDFAIEQMSTMDTIVFGRKTYQLMASFWPSEIAVQSDPIIADLMNRILQGRLFQDVGNGGLEQYPADP